MTQPALAQPAQAQHALCNVDDCHEPATAGYQWDWGERGFACSRHVFLLRQKAENLQRGVQFTVLDPHATPPLTRDERTRFHAQVLTLEDELRDAKVRGLELYQSNTRIAEEARRLAARNRELEVQFADMHAAMTAAVAQRDAHLADLGDATAELERLRMILPDGDVPVRLLDPERAELERLRATADKLARAERDRGGRGGGSATGGGGGGGGAYPGGGPGPAGGGEKPGG